MLRNTTTKKVNFVNFSSLNPFLNEICPEREASPDKEKEDNKDKSKKKEHSNDHDHSHDHKGSLKMYECKMKEALIIVTFSAHNCTGKTTGSSETTTVAA